MPLDEVAQRYASTFLALLAVHDALTDDSKDEAETVRVVPRVDGDAKDTKEPVSIVERGSQLASPASVAEMVVFPLRRRATSLHDVVEVGRLDVNDVVLRHPSVAGFHAVMHRGPDGGFCQIADRRTASGTFVDNTRLLPDGDTRILRPGQQVRLGQVSLVMLDVAGVIELIRSVRGSSTSGSAAS